MCNKCYESMDKNKLLLQLQDALNNPEFEKWNSTSVHFVVLTMTDENNCEELRMVATDLYHAYNAWTKEGPDVQVESDEIWKHHSDNYNTFLILGLIGVYIGVCACFFVVFK